MTEMARDEELVRRALQVPAVSVAGRDAHSEGSCDVVSFPAPALVLYGRELHVGVRPCYRLKEVG